MARDVQPYIILSRLFGCSDYTLSDRVPSVITVLIYVLFYVVLCHPAVVLPVIERNQLMRSIYQTLLKK